LSLGSCYVYTPVPMTVQPSMQQRFDRSWDAAAGALSDQGLAIVSQDRGAGMIRGERGSLIVVATIQALADGRIQVKFASQGSSSADPGLVQRVSDGYERRMGR